MTHPTITEIIAAGFDAAGGGEGFGTEHLKAVTLANAAPELLASLKDALRWLNSIAERYDIVDQMPNYCRGRVAMREAIITAETMPR